MFGARFLRQTFLADGWSVFPVAQTAFSRLRHPDPRSVFSDRMELTWTVFAA